VRRRVARRRARGVRSGVGRAGYAGMWAGLHVQAQSAQGMGAQKRGAAPLLGSGKARGVGVRRFGAALCVAAQHRQGASARLSSARAKKTAEGAVALIVVSSMSPQQPWSLCPATSLKYDAKSKKRQGLLQYMYMY
jgi:hypothetical protein